MRPQRQDRSELPVVERRPKILRGGAEDRLVLSGRRLEIPNEHRNSRDTGSAVRMGDLIRFLRHPEVARRRVLDHEGPAALANGARRRAELPCDAGPVRLLPRHVEGLGIADSSLPDTFDLGVEVLAEQAEIDHPAAVPQPVEPAVFCGATLFRRRDQLDVGAVREPDQGVVGIAVTVRPAGNDGESGLAGVRYRGVEVVRDDDDMVDHGRHTRLQCGWCRASGRDPNVRLS